MSVMRSPRSDVMREALYLCEGDEESSDGCDERSTVPL